MLQSQFEAMFRAGEYDLALREADGYYARGAGRRNRAEAAWVCHWASHSALGLRRWGLAVTWADRGLLLEPREPAAEGKLRFAAAHALMYLGDLLRAERELERFCTLARADPLLARHQPDGDFNMACVQRLLKRSAEARALFRQAEAGYLRDGRISRALLCRYEVAWGHLLEGMPDQAWPLLEGLEHQVGHDPELEADVALAVALFHSLTGRKEKADTICKEMIRRVDLLPRQVADAAWLLGRNAAASGDLEQAAEYLEIAYELAAPEWWPPQIERINLLNERVVRRGAPVR